MSTITNIDQALDKLWDMCEIDDDGFFDLPHELHYIAGHVDDNGCLSLNTAFRGVGFPDFSLWISCPPDIVPSLHTATWEYPDSFALDLLGLSPDALEDMCANEGTEYDVVISDTVCDYVLKEADANRDLILSVWRDELLAAASV